MSHIVVTGAGRIGTYHHPYEFHHFLHHILHHRYSLFGSALHLHTTLKLLTASQRVCKHFAIGKLQHTARRNAAGKARDLDVIIL